MSAWKAALLVGGECDNRQRRRNWHIYTRLKADLHRFVFDDPAIAGRTFRLASAGECFHRLTRAITNYFDTANNADLRLDELSAVVRRLLDGDETARAEAEALLADDDWSISDVQITEIGAMLEASRRIPYGRFTIERAADCPVCEGARRGEGNDARGNPMPCPVAHAPPGLEGST